jgi:hypothetical protein
MEFFSSDAKDVICHMYESGSDSDNGDENETEDSKKLKRFNWLLKTRQTCFDKYAEYSRKCKQSGKEDDRSLMVLFGELYDEKVKQIKKFIKKEKDFIDPDDMPHSPTASDEE